MSTLMQWRGHLRLAGVLGVAAVLSIPSVHAQRLGRLFTTPEQRSMLDETRLQAQFAQPELEPEPEPVASTAPVANEPREPIVSKLTVNGVVRRSGGRTTVWVNGDEVAHGGSTREGVAVEAVRRKTDVVRLRLPSGTQSIGLRPGQEIDVRSGLVLEPYEKGSGAEGGRSAFEQPASDTGADAMGTPAAGEPGAAGAGDAQVPPMPTGSQQGAAGGATVNDTMTTVGLAERLRAIARLPAEEQAAALAKLPPASVPAAGSPSQQQ